MTDNSKSALKLLRAAFLAALAIMAASCSQVKKISYLQDIDTDRQIVLQPARNIVLKKGDRLSINVFSRDMELANLFNLNSYSYSVDRGRNMAGTSHPYTIDDNGNIEMPILGPIHVEGLTRLEVASEVKYKLITSQMIRDPVVLVEYADVGFFVLGELGGEHINFTKDHLTILEAISLAGDLSISGRRDNVLVLRTEEGVQTSYRVDLTSVESVYSSPVFYIQQNDIIYVEPNVTKANTSDQLSNSTRTPNFWFSMFTMTVSVVTLIMNLLK